MNDTRKLPKFVAGAELFAAWREDVLTGTGPIVWQHTLPLPELSPGSCTSPFVLAIGEMKEPPPPPLPAPVKPAPPPL